MKKVVLLSALLLFALTSCVREQVAPEPVPEMTIRVEIPATPLSKASFSVPDGGTGLHLAWQDGDAVRVIDVADEGHS